MNKSKIETNFDEIDYFLSEVETGTIITLGARAGMGKTVWAMKFMNNLLKSDKKCLYCTNDIKLKIFATYFITQPFCLELSFGIKEIEDKIIKSKPDYVFIDDVPPTELLFPECINEIMTKLKVIAERHNTIIVVLQTLPRELENRKNKRPILSDLDKSIEEFSDVVIFLYRKWYYNCSNSDNKNAVEFIFAKNRFGETGTVHLKFEPLICEKGFKTNDNRIQK